MVPVDLTSARLMLTVLEDLAAGRVIGPGRLAELSASPGYDFYLRFHTGGNWEDAFTGELFTEMLLTLPDRPYTAPGPRLERIRRRFVHGLMDGFNAGTAIGREVTLGGLAMFPDTVEA